MKSKLTVEEVLKSTGWTKEWEARTEARLTSEFNKLISSVSSLQELKIKFKKMKIA